jgi:hypothetical protein
VRKLVHARPALLGTIAAASLAALPTGAGAQPAPKPAVGCAGQAFTDPTGDQIADYVGLGVGPTGPANTDITGGFFGYDGKTVTANLQIADLDLAQGGIAGQVNGQDASVPGGLMGVDYNFFYTLDGTTRVLTAARTGTTFSFHFGTYDANTGLLTTDGDTTGRIFDGKDGVIQIVVPTNAGGFHDKILAAPYAEVDNRLAVLASPADVAPDDGRGASYTVGACVDGASTGGGMGTPAPRPAGRLPLRAPLVLGSARTANARHRLSFKVRSTRTITNLRLVLRRSDGRGKAFATGTAKRVRGTRTIALRVLRRVKAGTYSLQTTGTVGGKRLRTAQQVRLRA